MQLARAKMLIIPIQSLQQSPKRCVSNMVVIFVRNFFFSVRILRNDKSSLYRKKCYYQATRTMLALMRIILCIKLVFKRVKLLFIWQIKIDCWFCGNKNDNHGFKSCQFSSFAVQIESTNVGYNEGNECVSSSIISGHDLAWCNLMINHIIITKVCHAGWCNWLMIVTTNKTYFVLIFFFARVPKTWIW